MTFSSKLTDEEEFLKKKYTVLRKKKKELQQLRMKRKQQENEAAENGPTKAKQKKGLMKSASDSILKCNIPERKDAVANIKNVSLNAAANTEAAKKLIKSGAIQVKVKTKTTFKRSLSKKKRDEVMKKPVFQPFSPCSGTGSSSDQGDDMSLKDQSNAIESNNNQPKKIVQNRKESPKKVKRERKFERHAPRKGNTIYIHGCDLTEKLLESHFQGFGKIIKIDIEQNARSAFITYNSLEAADVAIDKMNDAMVEGTRLKVSLARRQKMLESAMSSSLWAPLVVAQSDKGPTNRREKRALVVYDDDDMFSS
ncbi:negative elongation factor E-like [Styela clava]